jgi:phage shock protein C
MTASTGLGGTSPYPEPTAPAMPRRLYRSRADRKLAGVCAGIAEYYAADTSAVRIAAALIALVTGIVPGIVAYLIAAIVIPERTGAEVESEPAHLGAGRPGQGSLILGVLLVIVGAIALADQVLVVEWELVWPVALIGLGALLVALTRR